MAKAKPATDTGTTQLLEPSRDPFDLEAILTATEYRLLHGTGPTEGEERDEFPPAVETSLARVTDTLAAMREEAKDDGFTPVLRMDLDAIAERLTAQLVRVTGLADFLEANTNLAGKPTDQQSAALRMESKRLRQVQVEAHRAALRATHAQREAICSMVAFFDLSLCDGKAEHVFWMNIDPFATPATKARNERSFRDLDDKDRIGNAWPVIESATGADRQPLPVTLVPMEQKLVFQTGARIVVLASDVNGLLDLAWWADKFTKGGAVGFATVNRRDLGEGPFQLPDVKKKEKGTAVRLREKYATANLAGKSLVVTGNHVVAYPADDPTKGEVVEEKPVCVSPAMIYAAKSYGNEYGKPGVGITTTHTNSERDRLVGGSWFHSLLVPELRDRRLDLAGIPMAILMEIANRAMDDINVVFSSSRTMFSGAEHAAEVELGTNIVRLLVIHQLLMAKGTPLTNENAQQIGRDLNSVLQGLASKTDMKLPLLAAGCDSTQCIVADQIQRKDNGEPIVDAKGQPVLTGKKELVFNVKVELREGAENFTVHFVP